MLRDPPRRRHEQHAAEAADGGYHAVVRHDSLSITEDEGIAATVAGATFAGGQWIIDLTAGGHTVRSRHPESLEAGANVRVALTGALHLVADGA